MQETIEEMILNNIPYPSYAFSSSELVVFHHVTGN